MPNPKITLDVGGVRNRKWTDIAQDISNYCFENFKLSYPDLNFHLVDLNTLAGIVGAGGWPIHPETWQLEQESNFNFWGHKWGNFKVYEIVCPAGGIIDKNGVTTEPMDAFIYNTDTMIDTKLVISHVFGHAHVLTNNRVGLKARVASGYTSPYTEMVELTQLVEEEYGRQGIQPVVDILDAVNVLCSLVAYNPDVSLSRLGNLDDLSDVKIYEPLKRKKNMWQERASPVEDQIDHAFEARKKHNIYPNHKVNDIFNIIENSPALDNWEKRIVRASRRMQEYSTNVIAPVKVVHEGMASFCDIRFGMENTKHISDGQLKEYIQHRTNGMLHSKEQLNPYGLGLTMLYHIMMKWAKGEYGTEYDNITDSMQRLNWSKDKDLAKGWDKVLEVVNNYSDFDLIQNHLDMEYLTTFGKSFYVHGIEEYNRAGGGKIIIDRIQSKQLEDVRNALMFNYCNGGRPYFTIHPGDADYKDKGDLMITHEIDPLPRLFNQPKEVFTLNVDSVESILKATYFLWKRPVHLRTIDEHGDPLFISYYGKVNGGKNDNFEENHNEEDIM